MSESKGGVPHAPRVLVVDDDEDNREMLAMTLEQHGVRVVMARSARDALQVLENAPEKERPQVLVSDLGLPQEDGFSLLSRVRALPKSHGGDIPAIALTGRGGPADRERTLAAGFQAHLTKPVHIDELLSVIASLSTSSASSPG